ncbi:hypothetical protein BaRGS_00030281, partial [Batillaria attramentaria]
SCALDNIVTTNPGLGGSDLSEPSCTCRACRLRMRTLADASFSPSPAGAEIS